MKKFHVGHMLMGLCLLAIGLTGGMIAKSAYGSRNAAGTMTGINGPYVSGTTISSSVVNARFSDIETEITDSLDRSGKGGMLAALRGIDGTNAAPAVSFTSETGTGLYRVGAGNPAIAVSGVKLVDWTTSEHITVAGSATAVGLTSLQSALTNGNGTSIVVGRTNTINDAGSLFFVPNATAALSTFCLALSGGAPTALCVDGNAKTTANGALAVTGASTLTGALAANGGATIGTSGTAISASFYGTTAWNPGSIAAGSNASTTITLTGATAGAACIPILPNAGPGTDVLLTFECVVSANTCTLVLGNPGAGAVTGNNSTYGCRVFNN